MKYNIFSKITINDSIDLVTFNSLMITNDINALTDVCQITIPYRNMALTSESLTAELDDGNKLTISKGDFVKIHLDFVRDQSENDILTNELNQNDKYIFLGYINNFDTTEDIITINIDDSMYLFKTKKTIFSYPENTKAATVFENIIEEYDATSQILTQIVDTDLGKIKTSNYVTAARIFQQLKDKYKYFTYFRLDKATLIPTLFFGLKYPLVNLDETIPLQFEYPYKYITTEGGAGDVVSPSDKYAIIQNNLDYEKFDKTNDLIVNGQSKDNITNKTIKIATIDGETILKDSEKVNDKTVLNDSVKIKTENDNREIRLNLNVPNLDLEALSQLIKESWINFQDSGFKGSFTTFGTPTLYQGDAIELFIDDGFGEIINEVYYIDKVVTKVMPNSGFTQEVFLGTKIKT